MGDFESVIKNRSGNKVNPERLDIIFAFDDKKEKFFTIFLDGKKVEFIKSSPEFKVFTYLFLNATNLHEAKTISDITAHLNETKKTKIVDSTTTGYISRLISHLKKADDSYFGDEFIIKTYPIHKNDANGHIRYYLNQKLIRLSDPNEKN